MNSKAARISGWALSGVLVALFLFSASMKLFVDSPEMTKGLAELGWTPEQMKTVGVIEIAFALAFLLPRFGIWGAILLTAYLGGAVVTHMRVGQPWFMPIVIGVVIWVALGLRQSAVFRLARGDSFRERSTV